MHEVDPKGYVQVLHCKTGKSNGGGQRNKNNAVNFGNVNIGDHAILQIDFGSPNLNDLSQ